MRETEILVEQQPPQGVFVCDHAGLLINKDSLSLSSLFWLIAGKKKGQFIGVSFPPSRWQVGLGTYLLAPGPSTRHVVGAALRAGCESP